MTGHALHRHSPARRALGALAVLGGLFVASPAGSTAPHLALPQPFSVDGTDPTAYGTPRTLRVDLAPWTGVAEVDLVTYDLEAALRPMRARDLDGQPGWVVAVRLALSEVGAGRLVDNRWGTVEALGVMQTVRNRLDPAVWNPEGLDVRPWPGCEPAEPGALTDPSGFDAAFAACADPDQYLGLRLPRALRPRATTRDAETLTAAVDRAVEAWWLLRHDLVGDITGGATSFVHRCGGTAYGRPTQYCDRDPDPADIEGATSHTGPLVFKGPTVYAPDKRLYRMQITRVVDHEPGLAPTRPGGVASYLYARPPDVAWRGRGVLDDLDALDALWRASSGG